MQNPVIKITEDGSHTLYVNSIDESYHSTHGSIQESQHIFIQHGFSECKKETIQVLEIGFGTGLNAFLTALTLLPESEYNVKKINYTAIELFPVTVELALKLNYPELYGNRSREVFEKIHRASWNEKIQITQHFSLTKIQTDFTAIDFMQINGGIRFDVIYFDAFSPEKQPEMWSADMFRKLYHCAEDNAVLTTYCAKGAVRRAMLAAGFTVERLPGPPGKREILRAKKMA